MMCIVLGRGQVKVSKSNWNAKRYLKLVNLLLLLYFFNVIVLRNSFETNFVMIYFKTLPLAIFKNSFKF